MMNAPVLDFLWLVAGRPHKTASSFKEYNLGFSNDVPNVIAL